MKHNIDHHKVAMKARYGITPADYQQKLVEQNGVCAICHKLCVSKRRLAVDHNHRTKRIRGLLCSKCNLKLGGIETYGVWRVKAEGYLAYWSERHNQ